MNRFIREHVCRGKGCEQESDFHKPCTYMHDFHMCNITFLLIIEPEKTRGRKY